MKISVIHSVFRYNPLIAESLELNLLALEQSQVPYQYIVFNDNGDKSIFDDIKHLLNKNTEYIYSDINYGKHRCRGGWIGASKYITGDILHYTDQDDVMTSLFYENVYKTFMSNKNYMFFTSNAFVVNEDLSYMSLGLNPRLTYDTYKNVKYALRHCLGIKTPEYKITDLYNPLLTPGTVYRKELHDLIGLPDLDTFGGIADFEYWLRIMYYGYIGNYVNLPLFYFRMSQYTTGNEIIDGKQNRAYWHEVSNKLLIKKYSNLLEENKEAFI